MRNAVRALCAGLVLAGAGVAHFAIARAPGADGSPDVEVHGAADDRERGAGASLDAAARALVGIEVAEVQAAELPVEHEAYGAVLDPTPLAALVYEVDAARAAHAAARSEAERVERLYGEDRNASERDREAAEVALARATSDLETARARLVSTAGDRLARRDDLSGWVRGLVSGERALVRVDLPPGATTTDEPSTARIVAFGAAVPLETRFVGSAPQADPLLQGRGLLFEVLRDPPPPGTAVEAWLPEPGGPRRGVEVPRAALLRHDGEVFVYVEHGTGRFERRAIQLVRPGRSGWLVTGPLSPGESVVVSGASILLSSELQSRLEED